MKIKIILFFAMCFLSVLLLCPTAASAKTAPKKLALNYKSLTLYAGETESLQVSSVKPDKASKNVIWKSKKPGIASVSAKGRILAKKAGKTEITAVSRKNPKISKSVKVTVRKRPKKVEKKLKIDGDIYDPSDDGFEDLANALYQLDSYRKNGYMVVRSKEAFRRLAGKNSALFRYAGTNFKKDCLVFLKCWLYRACEEQVAGFYTKFDTAGKLYGQAVIQYKRMKDEPGYAYPAVMDDYVIILRISRKDAAMADYFQCVSKEMGL